MSYTVFDFLGNIGVLLILAMYQLLQVEKLMPAHSYTVL